MQEDHNTKIERIALQLNKSGLSYLSNQQSPSSAFDYFKKAEKMLNAQVQVDPTRKSIQRLLAVTSNNLAIYYKRTNKPKAALTYLKNALQIETFILEDWLATATTHLNICAIYSYMGKHEEAVDHANLSIQNAKKAVGQSGQAQKDTVFLKSCSNVELASTYNLAVEYQHLKKYQDAIETYKKSRETAKNLGRKNIETNSQESIDRLSGEMVKNRRKIIELLQKKKQNQQKGNYESMRKNKKNFKSHILPEQPGFTRAEQYNVYNDQKKSQSVSKLISIRPTRSQSTQGIKRVKQSSDRKHIIKELNSETKHQ